MTDEKIMETVDTLLKKFIINVNQIQNNSDNDMDDIRNEAVIVVIEFYEQIQENSQVFINELKRRCLKFNKYNRRIESKERWERFNSYEEMLPDSCECVTRFDDDIFYNMIDIESLIGAEQLQFLIDYYSYGVEKLASKTGKNTSSVKKKAKKLRDYIRKNYKER